jgi:hypothetical protein
MESMLHRLFDRLYGRPLIRNVLRGELVEQIILDALGEEWLAADDYASWDIAHRELPVTIQVKQSAARQSWSVESSRPSVPTFRIDERYGYSEARQRWDEPRQRHASIYIFAWHAAIDHMADHREASQWQFHVIAADRLPSQNSIGLKAIAALAPPASADDLRLIVEGLK